VAETYRNRGEGPHIDILEEWAAFADSFVARWSGLGKRVLSEPSGRGDRFGPSQDIWMTMASAAGDLAEMSYRCAQALDGLAGFSFGPHEGDDWDEDEGHQPEPPAKAAARKGGRAATAKAATKAAARKTTARKTASKKAASKKAASKKTVSKKAASKKAASKKAASRRKK
jgi:hypothetical protein